LLYISACKSCGDSVYFRNEFGGKFLNARCLVLFYENESIFNFVLARLEIFYIVFAALFVCGDCGKFAVAFFIRDFNRNYVFGNFGLSKRVSSANLFFSLYFSFLFSLFVPASL